MDRTRIGAVYVMAFLSGAAALVYQIAWAKMLALTFGSTTLSAGAVIAGFMGGMGLGAWLYHHLGHRVARPLAAYAGLEFGIAATALALTISLHALPRLFAAVAGHLPGEGALLFVRLVTVFALLLVPAMLMGATFPALCTALIRSARGLDLHLGAIYGVNTVGAACGALLGGLVLIPALGHMTSVFAANGVNVAVGFAALILARTTPHGESSPSRTPEAMVVPTELPRLVTGLVLFGSGFTTLGYEIVWFRALRYLVGNSTYALTVVLFVFLVGLGLGSLLLPRVVARGRPERDLAACQIAIALLALAAAACQAWILGTPALREQISVFSVTTLMRPWPVRLSIVAAVSIAMLLPATIFMGLSFPLASRLFLGNVQKLGQRVGRAYLLANGGSILGSIGAAVVVLPWLGSLGATRALALVNLALGAAILFALHKRGRALLPALVIATAIVAVSFFAMPAALVIHGEGVAPGRGGGLVFSEEGVLATVQVLRDPADRTRQVMTINGYSIGWSAGFAREPGYRKQLLLAHLPMVLDTRLDSALAVGLGSATTVAALATHPGLRAIDCVEIDDAVVRGSRHFTEAAVLDDPRVRLIVEDAVHYLLRPGPRYDLIVSDGKQDHFSSANSVLFSREYYRYALERMSERGLFVQWIPLGTLGSDLRVILRTFLEVFPEVDLFYFPMDSLLFVGAREPLAGRPALDDARLGRLAAGRDLARYGMTGRDALLARWVTGRAPLVAAVGAGPLSTWDRPIVDLSAYRATVAEWSTSAATNLELLIRAGEQAGAPPGGAGSRPIVESTRLLRRAFLHEFRGERAEAIRLAEQAERVNPDDPEAKVVLRLFRGGVR